MLNAQDINEIENILQSTGYASILNEVRPSVNLTQFEVALRRKYAKLLALFEVAASPKITTLLHAYSMKIEAENISLILQAIIRNNVSDNLINIIIPVGKFGLPHYRRMMEFTKAELATDFIIDLKLRKVAQKALNLSEDPDEQIFFLSSALSHASFLILQKVVPNWIRREIEFLNLETAARAVKLGIDTKSWMIPNNGMVNRHESAISSMKTPREVLSYFLPLFPVSKPLEYALQAQDDEIISVLEENVLLYLFHRHNRNFRVHGRRIEAILDFFAIKRAEIEDISRILLSSFKDIPTEKIQGMVMFPIYRR